MHLICESRLYRKSSDYFAHNLIVQCSLYISQSDYMQKCILFFRLLESYVLSITMYYIIQIPHHYDK